MILIIFLLCLTTAIPEETIQRLNDNLLNLDRYLGPYPYDMWKQWQELTNRIDLSIIDRCAPVCGYVFFNNYVFITSTLKSTLKFKNGTFTIKLEYLTVLTIFRTSEI